MPDPLTRAFSLAGARYCLAQLLCNLQGTRSGDMKQGWPCLCGLQGVSHLDRVPWVRGSLWWLCLLPTPQGLETVKAHVLLHGVCVCAHFWEGAGVWSAHTNRVALEGTPCRQPCRIQLSVRNISFYSWQCGSIPLCFGVVGSQQLDVGSAGMVDFIPTPSTLPCPG